MAKTISKRGQTIDFDLMRIHQSLSNAEAPSVVVQRQTSIEDRLQQRRLQRQNLRNRKKEQQEQQEELAIQPTVDPIEPTVDPIESLDMIDPTIKSVSKRPKRVEQGDSDDQ